jgi:hypothetical protein
VWGVERVSFLGWLGRGDRCFDLVIGIFGSRWKVVSECGDHGLRSGLRHIHSLTTLHSFFTDSNTLCHAHMANTIFLHLAITSSS